MTNATTIEWTDTTWNPTVGCSRVSEGCRNCYAERMAKRLASMESQSHTYRLVVREDGRWNGNVIALEERLTEPLSWKKPRRVFVDSMSDLFHEAVPFEFIDKVFAVMALCPQHTFQVLTKRPERMAEYLTAEFRANRIIEEMPKVAPDRGVWCWPTWREAFARVWLGTSIEDQATADERIPHLLRCPAAVRFLSCEPLLGAVNLGTIRTGLVPMPGVFISNMIGRQLGIGWVIVGGESGPGARPMHPDWVRSLRDQCVAARVPVFVKQDSGPKPGMQGRIPDDLWAVKQYPEVCHA